MSFPVPQDAVVGATRHDDPPSANSICDLPYDVLFELFTYLCVIDIAYLLSTCRALHRYTLETSIWQRLSARYGLRNLSHFGGLSFYTVYTQLLHPYGPVIGLWASDHPYRGNVIEFRLIPGDESEQGGIVGEVWRFPEARLGNATPHPPEYVRVLKIGFDSPRPSAGRRWPDGPKTASVFCSPQLPSELDEATADQWHAAALEVVPPSGQAYFLQGYRRTFAHPDFPMHRASWYDETRGLPRLRPSSPIVVDQRELVRIYPAVRLPIIFTASTPNVKPSAISVHCLSDTCAKYFQPLVPFDDLAPAPPRYYPLRRDVQKGVDPASEHWHLRTLAGLWLGSYAQHGTECLYVAWHEDDKELRAWKITGDINVPRGACTWIVRAHSDTAYPALLATWFGMNPTTDRVFEGTGTISDRGFLTETHVDLVVGITGADEIKIWWDQVNDLRTYVRYTGRNE
ncbi:hypothetical protein AcV5_006761 [Taiwanofungus camphoratus]|nr:hypothetical protein AcV5_006761 [Antrodia cinnamomea]